MGFALLLCLLAGLAAALSFSAPAEAQEDTEYEYVDLLLLYEHLATGKVLYSVRNIGTATATGVTVSFLLEDLDLGPFVDSPSFPDEEMDNINKTMTFTWEVGTLLPGDESTDLEFATGLHDGHSTANRIGVINATAEALQPEPGILSANNVIKLYSFARTSGGALHMKGNKLGLLLSVDDLRPAPGDDLNVDLTARNYNIVASALSNYINLIDDIEIKVELSDGLEFKSTTDWTRPTGFVTSGQSATWKPEPVDAKSDPNVQADFPRFREIEIQTELTSDTLAVIPLEDRCITAWVVESTPPPAADYPLGSLKQCLGDDPLVLFEKGDLDLFTLYPCVGVSPIAYPCRDDDSDSTVDNGLELVAKASLLQQPVLQRSGIARGYGSTIFYLRPGNVLVRVDPEARVGTKWYTGSDENKDTNDAGIIPGALVHMDFLGDDWKPYTFAIADVSPKKRPGSMSIPRMDNTGFTILDADTKTSLGPVNQALDEIPLVVIFGTLGTHQVDLTLGGSKGGTAYTSTGTYTFHVGPVAELEVRDGGERPDLGADQRAFTIVAVNNGPDDAPNAQVTLTGLDATTCTGTATKGSLAFARSECTWTIGELITKDVSQPTNGRDGEILTVITTAAVDTEITAEIENDQDYQVCIDSSGDDVALSSPSSTACTTEDSTNTWHTTAYYDYNDDYDSATIKAKDGTGADLPTLKSPVEDTASIIVEWDAIDEIYGRGVTHYEVQRETNPWETVADDVTGTRYVDTNVEEGDSFRYRIRAVNDWGHRGPWSAPMTGTVMEPETPDPEVITETETVFRDRVVTRTETETVTVEVPEAAFAYFSPTAVTRSVLENSAAGSPVGAPVAVIRNSGNSVTYSLEGTDAALFSIEADTGQILVGQDTVLDYESGTTSYSVEVVADPSSGEDVKATVTINVVDVVENATVAITPAGQPEVDTELTATLTHEGGDPTDPTWQWQRSTNGRLWLNIAGATAATYTPTAQDAGHMLRAIVIYGEPSGDGHGVATMVTEALAGEAPSTTTTLSATAAAYDANGDGSIDLTEVFTAIADYFDEDIDLNGVLEVINAYFAG